MPLYDHAGKLLLRLTIGLLMLPHGLAKLFNDFPSLTGPSAIKMMLVVKGLPTWLVYGVYATEIAAPVLLVLGLFTRSAALVVALGMLVAVYLARLGAIDELSSAGTWGVQTEALFLFGALAICLLYTSDAATILLV